MLFVLSILASIGLANLAAATPSPRSLVVQESREAPPTRFSSLGAADSSTVLNLRVALASTNISGLETTLYAVSTPGSSQYGQWLSVDEVGEYFSPSSEAISAVTSWLQGTEGVSNVSPVGTYNTWISFSTNVGTANELLDANFETFVDANTGASIIRTLAYSLPEDLLEYVDLVHPTTSFAVPIPKNETMFSTVSKRSTDADRNSLYPDFCASITNPQCLNVLYNIPTTAATQSSNSIAVSGFLQQFVQIPDVLSFLNTERGDTSPATPFTLLTVDGGENIQDPNQAGIEADLDVEYTAGVATNVPIFFVSVGSDNNDGVDGFVDIINFLSNMTSPPQVLTTSYGFNEADLGAALATQVCNTYMAFTARGVSLLFASGDGGVSGVQSEDCTEFVPTFPSTCPFVTSVGGTNLFDNAFEAAADFSAGGFSNVFAQPSYQASAVAEYLSQFGDTDAGLFNASGRGFPDLSAIATNIEVFYQVAVSDPEQHNPTTFVDGTSAASPIVASIIGLINDRLIAAGKPALGFLNPLLYANPDAFFDMTFGNNAGCGTNGFSALNGWDPITGLGTPDFNSLLAVAGL